MTGGPRPDPARLYAEQRERISALVRELAPDWLGAPVPATPAWTVLQLVAHLTGLAAEVAVGYDLPAAATELRTAGQVADRAGVPLRELLAEWERVSPAVEAAIPELRGAGWRLVYDASMHEGDLREALGLPPGSDSSSYAVVLTGLLTGAGRRIEAAGLPALRVLAGDRDWLLGAGAPAVVLVAEEHELLRALSGRRSRRAMAARGWDGDPTPYLDLLPAFPPPDDPA